MKRRAGWGLEEVVVFFLLGMALLACGDRACADPPWIPCSWSIAQWTATEIKAGENQSVVLGARLEGQCFLPLPLIKGVIVGARVDGLALPGSDGKVTVPSLSDLGTVQAIEGYFAAWRPVSTALGGISFAGVVGGQHAIDKGQIGLGSSTFTLGAGLRIGSHGSMQPWLLAVVGRYAPAGPGTKVLVTFELPISERVTFAGNAGIGRVGSFIVAGPAIRVGN